MSLSRWLASSALAASLAVAAFSPSPAHANDDLIRVIVDLSDVVIRSGQPYYRHGGYGYNDRLIVERDRYGRPIYYRYVPRYRDRPPYGNAYGYHRNHHDDSRDGRYSRRVCDSRGRCRVEYYDPRYDRRGRHHDYGYRHHRDWDDRRWKDGRDDD